jgi:23S rRNA pseudouridine1911/1915/1917 synthase
VEDKLELIFEDANIIVINKPCGMAVQSKEEDIIKYYSSVKNIELHPITRIDQSVSGLSLFSKNAKSAALMTRMLKEGKISKSYTAVVEGIVQNPEGILEHKILKVGQKSIVSEQGKDCSLHYKVVHKLDRYTRLEVTSYTGRFHQIRAQLSAIGHPIKGDLKYHSRRSNKEGGIYLHCQLITLLYQSGELRLFEGNPPKDKTLYFV